MRPSAKVVGFLCSPLLLAGDRATLNHMVEAFRTTGMAVGFATAKGQAAIAHVSKMASEETPLVLIAPQPKLGLSQLSLVREVVQRGGLALGWISEDLTAGPELSDHWLVERLIEHEGAKTSCDLSVLIEAARIAGFVGAKVARCPLSVYGRPKGLVARVEGALTRAGLNNLGGRKDDREPGVKVSANGDIELVTRNERHLPVHDLAAFAGGLGVLFQGGLRIAADSATAFKPVQADIDLIVRPPARLLSETASKRLLAAFGLVAPREKLCQSPSEAVRFAGSLAGAAVMKLVRPALEHKRETGAIVTGVSGPAAVRRGVHALRAVAASLGPPEALGILVAEEITGGDRIWLQLVDHSRFGRVVVLGRNDLPGEAPFAALRPPVSDSRALDALVRANAVQSEASGEKLAVAVGRCARLLFELGQGVDRAEIGPLVTVDDQPDALVLDALIGIADLRKPLV